MLRIVQLGYSTLSEDSPTPIQVLSDINLSAKQGEFLTIVGPNGCGKTTLLKIIAGLNRPTKGYIFLREEKINGPGQGVGMVFQEIGLLPWKTVQGNIAFSLVNARQLNRRDKKRLVEQYMKLFGLNGFMHYYPHQVSGGMRQKVAIARTLITEPDVLLMDEPFAALDCLTRNSLQEFLITMWQKTNKTVIFVTHDVDEAVFMSERVAVMSRLPGKIIHEIQIDLPYPRNRTDEYLQRIRGEILTMLAREIPPYDVSMDFTHFSYHVRQ